MVDILQLCADGWQVLSDRVELARGNRAPIGLMVAHEIFIHKPTLLAVINAEIDAKADDKNALTPEARQQRSSAVQSELLRVERDLSALIWRGLREGLNVEFGDVSPIAILSCEIITAPARASDGTSVEHGWDIIEPTRP